MSESSGDSNRFLPLSRQNISALLQETQGQLTGIVNDTIRAQLLSGQAVRLPSAMMQQGGGAYVAPLGNVGMRPILRHPGMTQAPAHTHSHIHTHQHQHQQDQQTQQDHQNTVIDLETFLEESPPPSSSSSSATVQGQGQGQGQSGPVNFEVTQAQLTDIMKLLQNALSSFLPFLILAFVKVMYDHRFGILVFCGFLGSFEYINIKFCQLTSRTTNTSSVESLQKVGWLVLLISLHIGAVYYCFSSEQLYLALYFMRPTVEGTGVWALLWVTGVTDFIVKFGTILVKSLILSCPRFIMPFGQKGSYYMLIESLSQMYRSLLPIVPWFYFLLDFTHGGEYVSYVLICVYAVAKFYNLSRTWQHLKAAAVKFRTNFRYGTVPDKSALDSSNVCPICQDELKGPVMLSCKHVFCDDCICMWFDRDRTCPMCRTAIVASPRWRDGATWNGIQFY